jgi:transcription regulator MmyB-like protein
MARAVLADFTAMPARERNATRWILLEEAARSLYGDSWAKVGSEVVGTLRMDAARHPDDPRTAELVGELAIKSEHFRRWWADQKVVQWTHDVKVLHHPIAGTLTLATEAVTFPGEPDQVMFTLLPKPGSPTQQALTMLSTWLETNTPHQIHPPSPLTHRLLPTTHLHRVAFSGAFPTTDRHPHPAEISRTQNRHDNPPPPLRGNFGPPAHLKSPQQPTPSPAWRFQARCTPRFHTRTADRPVGNPGALPTPTRPARPGRGADRPGGRGGGGGLAVGAAEAAWRSGRRRRPGGRGGGGGLAAGSRSVRWRSAGSPRAASCSTRPAGRRRDRLVRPARRGRAGPCCPRGAVRRVHPGPADRLRRGRRVGFHRRPLGLAARRSPWTAASARNS